MRGRLAVVLGHARARGGGGRRIGREHGRRRPAVLGNEAPAASSGGVGQRGAGGVWSYRNFKLQILVIQILSYKLIIFKYS